MHSFLRNLYFLADGDAFEDLKNIAEKIIPNDPWAFVVQLTATFILVVILWIFLVKPVRKYVAERQAYIQGNLDEAKTKNEQADENIVKAEKMLKDAKVQSKQIVEEAKVTALNEKDKITEETKLEVVEMKNKAKSDIENERKQMKDALQNEIIDVALSAASKVIEREVNEKDNKKVIDSFIKDDKE